MVYLFVGQDPEAKDARLTALRQEHLGTANDQFNFERLLAPEISLHELQEKLLCLPVNNRRRLVYLAGVDTAKKEMKEFLSLYSAKPYAHVVLVAEARAVERKDTVLSGLARHARVERFKEYKQADTFTLARSIEAGNASGSLRTLRQLLESGEKPERILGGLRYSWERAQGTPQTVRRIKQLLLADAAIKTGRLKPELALERLVVSLTRQV